MSGGRPQIVICFFFMNSFWMRNAGPLIRTSLYFSRQDASKHVFVNPERSRSNFDVRWPRVTWAQGLLVTERTQYAYNMSRLNKLWIRWDHLHRAISFLYEVISKKRMWLYDLKCPWTNITDCNRALVTTIGLKGRFVKMTLLKWRPAILMTFYDDWWWNCSWLL